MCACHTLYSVPDQEGVCTEYNPRSLLQIISLPDDDELTGHAFLVRGYPATPLPALYTATSPVTGIMH
jgi:hypothetical protein